MEARPGLRGALRGCRPASLPGEATPPRPPGSSRQAPCPAPAPGRLSRLAGWRLAFPFIEKILPLDFFERDTLEVARDLLGKVLVREVAGRRLTGRLVEVEAYLGPDDLAAHSARGLTPRNQVMFGPAGHVYVFLIYGMWCCLNFVTRPSGVSSCRISARPTVKARSGPLSPKDLEIDSKMGSACARLAPGKTQTNSSPP